MGIQFVLNELGTRRKRSLNISIFGWECRAMKKGVLDRKEANQWVIWKSKGRRKWPPSSGPGCGPWFDQPDSKKILTEAT